MKRPENAHTLYGICIEEAIKSPCQKRGFGAILMQYGDIIGVDHNRPIPGIEYVCQEECIRFKIPSGMDSMIGSCGHAEEWLIWEALKEGKNLEKSELYVAGVDQNKNLLIKTEPYFYCVRCATAMLRAGVAGVHVFSNGEWHFLTSEEAYKSSLEFALGEKKA